MKPMWGYEQQPVVAKQQNIFSAVQQKSAAEGDTMAQIKCGEICCN